LLTPKIFESGALNFCVIFCIAPLLVNISDATVIGKSEGISILKQVLSARVTSLLASAEFLSKTAKRKIAVTIENPP
jgi:hypothetical protein